MDKYGRVKQNSYQDGDDTKYARFTYQSSKDGASLAASKLESVYDSHEDRTYKYNYDYNNALTGWECRQGNSTMGENYLSVHQISVGETKYSIGKATSGVEQYVPEKYKTQVVYDETCTIDPLIVKTAVYYDKTKDDDDKDFEEMKGFSRNYYYDGFGRLDQVKYTDNYIGSDCKLTDTYTYYDDTENGVASPLIKKYMHERKDGSYTYTTEMDYTYDEKGRIIANEIKGRSAYEEYDSSEYRSSKTYQYDGHNRIISETTRDINDNESVNEYVYENHKLVKAGNRTIGYEESGRDKGKINYSGDGSENVKYEYDAYGNRSALYREISSYGLDSKYEYERGNLLKRIYKWDNQDLYAEYGYNREGVRFKKTVDGVTTTYYLDGAKLLGEDRSDGKKLRYFYDLQGVCGFSYNNGSETKKYNYIRDCMGNIVGIENIYGKVLCRYEYNVLGKCQWVNWSQREDAVYIEGEELGWINPFRWKGYYYDHETGFYYANGRYYDPAIGVYVDADDPENILENATVIGGLDKNAITLDNHLTVSPNDYDIFTVDKLTADITYDGMENVTWWEKNWLNVVGIVLQLVAVVVSVLTGCVPALVGSLIGLGFSVAHMILSEVSPGYAKLMSGLGTIGNGSSAIATGISLLGTCNPVCWVMATMCFVVGTATVAIGVNEAICGATGVNYLREWTGVSQSDYERLYLGLNIASTVCTIAGQAVRSWRGSNCFIAGTLVLCMDENGNQCHKLIEEIKIGDKVWAYDEKTGENDWKPVVRLFRNETKAWYHVFVDGEEIVCTGGHPFYVVDEGFVETKDLKNFDKLLLSDGRCVTIEKIEVETLETAETTYNFEVADSHTYYVTEMNVLVHNRCGQEHHAISRKIEREMRKNSKLNNISRDDKRFLVKAFSKDGHRGYQKWHRQYDKVMSSWLRNHPNASAGQFINKLNSYYSKSNMVRRFGKVLF